MSSKAKSPEKKPVAKIIGGIEYPDPKSKEVMGALQKMKAVTPTAIAAQFNIKVSVAKKMIAELEEMGVVHLVATSSNLKVYALTQKA